MDDFVSALHAPEPDEHIGCVVITGSGKAFPAGADIIGKKTLNHMEAHKGDLITRNWERLKRCHKPVIAVGAGCAMGDGCDLAKMGDFVIAAENAVLAQPEIPRHPAKRRRHAASATRSGARPRRWICVQPWPNGCAGGGSPRTGHAGRGCGPAVGGDPCSRAEDRFLLLPAVMEIKECPIVPTRAALRKRCFFERPEFHSAFALDDQKEGVAAFVEKQN